LYKKKFTIKGAKLHLKEQYEKNNTIPSKVETVKLNAVISKEDLQNIRKSLNDILTLIGDYKK